MSGIPQGSVLGQLLLVIYNIDNVIESLKFTWSISYPGNLDLFLIIVLPGDRCFKLEENINHIDKCKVVLYLS